MTFAHHRSSRIAHAKNPDFHTEGRPSLDEFEPISANPLTMGHPSKPEKPYVYGASFDLAKRTMDLDWIAEYDRLNP